MHNTDTTTNTTTNIIPTKTSKAEKIRQMLNEGASPMIIAAVMDVSRQYVYGVRANEKSRKAKAKAKQKMAVKKAKLADAAPKRKYVKSGKYSKKAAVVEAPTPPAVETRPVFVEVPVPQPHYNLTWKQRFVALFTGRV